MLLVLCTVCAGRALAEESILTEVDHKSRTARNVASKSVEADRTPVALGAPAGLGGQTLSIQYPGVNLTRPERVTCRYRLDGLDDSWQNAGHRTVALYPRPPPGTYTFHVEASNDGNTWTQPVSSATIIVLPSIYQTKWFLALCAIAGLTAAWFLVTLRIRAVTREVRARAEERADERIRISRELHDTLLQGIQGLLLTFHVAAQKVPADDESRKLLDSALSTADRIIVEGRNRVNSLRSEHLTDAELAGSLENVGRDLRIDGKVAFQVIREGSNATLHAHIADEVFYIAREALTNAFRHSGASEIVLSLVYGPRYFSMACKDNGRGFDSRNNEQPGHWGLTGMSERAQGVGGELHCRSEPARGTEILFVLPSYRAYKNRSRLMFYLRAFRLSERDPANL
jgi:signal transduction histidine kinase